MTSRSLCHVSPQVECGSKESDGFVVYVDNTTYKCHTEDQELTVSSLVRQRVHTGVLVCPSYREACMVRRLSHRGSYL